MVTAHKPVPEQAPPQPAKVVPATADAVSETLVPGTNLASQEDVQLIPAGLLVTVPFPFPGNDTARSGFASNPTVTCLSEFISRSQLPVPLHAPPQPVKWDPASEVAVRVTAAPLAKLAEQTVPLLPQLIPAGLLVRVPVPVPVVAAFTMNGPFDEPPVSNCCCGLHGSSSVTAIVALRVPLACGV